MDYSDVQGGWTGAGANNIDDDPLFDANHHLQCGSPCINSGDDNAVPVDQHDVNENGNNTTEKTPDRDLKPRLLGIVDRGAYEKEFERCTADTNDDGSIDVTDLLEVINKWGSCPAPPTLCPADVVPGPCDGQGDGVVDVSDLLAVINGWGACDGTLGAMPETINDCMNECATIYTSGSPEWADCVDKCVIALCESGRLDPEECP